MNDREKCLREACEIVNGGENNGRNRNDISKAD